MGVKITLMVKQETIDRLEALVKKTYRGKGDVVDWAIKLAWSENELAEQRASITEDGRRALQLAKEGAHE